MKAFIIDRYGSSDGVRIGEMPDPELREDDVLVQVHAAGVNVLDSKIRNGEFKRRLNPSLSARFTEAARLRTASVNLQVERVRSILTREFDKIARSDFGRTIDAFLWQRRSVRPQRGGAQGCAEQSLSLRQNSLG